MENNLTEGLGQWLDRAMDQLRSKKARLMLREELSQHLADQYQGLLDQGQPPQLAEQQTLQAMGDPVLAGSALDRVHRPRPAIGQIAAVAAFFFLGALLRWVLGGGASLWGHLPGAVAAVTGFLLLAWVLDVSLLARYAGILYVLFFAAAAAALAFGPRYGGRAFWLYSLLPAFAPLWALAVYRQRGKGWPGLLLAGALVLPGLIFAVLAPGIGTAVVMGLGCLAVFLWCCKKNWFGISSPVRTVILTVLALLAAGLLAVGLWLLAKGGLWGLLRRAAVLFDPWAEQRGSGWQGAYLQLIHRATRLWGQGADPALLAPAGIEYPHGLVTTPLFWGEGAMLSCLAWRYGALPVLALVGLAAVVLALLWRAALRTRNALGQLLGAACMAFLSGQLACNLLYNLGLCPFAGFFAFADCGNVMLCAQAALAGVVVSAFRQDPVTAGPAMGELPAAAGVPDGRVSYRDGVLTIRLRG